MIEIADIRIPVAQLAGDARAEGAAIMRAVTRRLRVGHDGIASLALRRRSIDARRKGDVRIACVVRVRLRGGDHAESALLARLHRAHADRGVRVVADDSGSVTPPAAADPRSDVPERAAMPGPSPILPDRRVVVVGAGCAGLFCALALARAGLRPLLVERGDDAARRTDAIASFNADGTLDVESNVQFGVGGAGTFSDGKLATGTKSPAHQSILEELVAAGAPRSILWDARPHVGSDVLPLVVTRLVAAIRAAGGEVRTRTALVDLRVAAGRLTGVTLATHGAGNVPREEHVATSAVVLACGHSARDVFALLRGRGVALQRKPFAMGVRIEHAQAAIDRAQYGPAAGHPALGAAPYRLATHVGRGDARRGVFTFCMCPGGYVVAAASEPDGVVTNGMSLSGRDGANANAGLLVDVSVGDPSDDLRAASGAPLDWGGSRARDDVLAGVALQRACERAAFAAGGGGFVAPAQLVGDFLQGVPSAATGGVRPTYPRGVSWGSVEACLPGFVTDALRAGIPLLARRMRGFDAADAVLTAVETRSSSPVRIARGADGQSVSVVGLYPCGEGAGYAGGIMSAAADGLRCAAWVAEALAP